MKRVLPILCNACFLLAYAIVPTARAAETGAADPPATQGDPPEAALSASAHPQRQPWQEHLTLGAGDTLNISLFEKPETLQRDVPIRPDGRLSFLEAQDVAAAGLTIDELRARLDETLGQFYQNPRTIITPVLLRSKKYYVLGAVPRVGVYALERPVTIVEALAHAGGLETGLYTMGGQANVVELADLAHSFLERDGKKLPVDFEALFGKGDLSQNVPLAPGDYLYVALASANEIYVLGEVNAPGLAAFLPRTTVIGAISARGGFTVRAFKSRVLVARGSINHPQTFVVDTSAILTGKQPDFKLQAKDIVYVSLSPWVRAEEIIDAASTAFIQGMVVGTTTRKVGPFLSEPLIH